MSFHREKPDAKNKDHELPKSWNATLNLNLIIVHIFAPTHISGTAGISSLVLLFGPQSKLGVFRGICHSTVPPTQLSTRTAIIRSPNRAYISLFKFQLLFYQIYASSNKTTQILQSPTHPDLKQVNDMTLKPQ